MNRSGPLQQPGLQLLPDEHSTVVGGSCACDPAFPCASDAAPAQAQGWEAAMAVPDPAMLQLRGLMAGLGLIARPVL